MTMKVSSTLLLLVIVLLPQQQQVLAVESWQLLWSDEFSGTALNTDVWSFDVGFKSDKTEQQYYTNGSNVAVADGKLVITARKENFMNNSYTSARIKTAGKVSWCPNMTTRSGTVLSAVRFDVRMKVPKGQGLWPAAWLLPDAAKGGVYGSWPSSGELDIIETINTAETASGTIHYGGYVNSSYIDHRQSGAKKYNTPLHTDYHTFSAEWRPNTIRWLLDEKPYGSPVVSKSLNATSGWFTLNKGSPGSQSVTPEVLASRPNAPFDQPFYLILNLAVGGKWPGPANDSTPMPADLLVDWVRVFGASVL